LIEDSSGRSTASPEIKKDDLGTLEVYKILWYQTVKTGDLELNF